MALVTSWPRIVPTVRLTFRILSEARTASPVSSAGRQISISIWSSASVQRVVLAGHVVQRRALGQLGLVQDRPQVEPVRLPVLLGRPWCPAPRRGRSPRPGVRKPSAARCSRTSSAMNSKKLITNSGLPENFLPQLGVLGGDADRAGVQVADPHHDAAADHQRRGREAELLGPEQRADDHVAAGLQLAVDLDHDPVPQAVEQQGLLGLGQAELPGPAGVLERGERRGPGAAVVPGDQHHVGLGLGDPGGDRPDADLGHQLDVHPRGRVGALQVVDQLLEVLDRVDVVVRRRRDQARPRAWSAGSWPPTDRPSGRAADHPRRAWRPGPS